MENHHAINGKIHYKWAIFNSDVSLPEGTWWFFSATELQLQEIHWGEGQCAGINWDHLLQRGISEPPPSTDLRWTTVKKNPRDQYEYIGFFRTINVCSKRPPLVHGEICGELLQFRSFPWRSSYSYPDAPCMEYLPTFGWLLGQM